ncbi:MAG: CoB--CoM heterodisulfide reductase iron-sulfur subunit B family protein [Candidatus Aminicenantes bacterium]|nr:CoB--CoM heterodisulfide reductase iron-sulfur subunit B family protein [Candidatus Aminicenantes bacterium]
MKDYAYFPGCSLKENSKHYEESILPVFKAIGHPLEELEDWNCCGATAYFSVDNDMAAAVCGRNLSLAEKQGKDILAPCAGCYLTLKKSNLFLQSGAPEAKKILGDLKRSGCEYQGRSVVKHPLEVLVREIGLDVIRKKVVRKLTGLKVACYYGCQVVRPYTDFDDPDHPTSLDALMEALGAEPVDYSAKTRCCGGLLTGTIENVGLRLNHLLLKEAKRKGADVIVTVCPLCLFNLELFQDKIIKTYKEDVRIPILFFSQLMGLALGLSRDDLGFSRSTIPLDAFWAKIRNGGQNV